ncbi:Co-chaperone Hsc20 [Trametes polyzona]|nr:Co-chaperone Hsc20 [Trametes polyzona]
MFHIRVRALASLALRAHPRPPCRVVGRGLYTSRLAPQSPSIGARRNHDGSANRVKTCPSCSSPLPTALPVCSNCSYIEPIPKSMSYHEMLGASYEPNPFVVDVAKLKNQFRAVQAIVHPDRWVSKPPEQQAIAAAMSSRINEAYSQLSNPLRRAEYILAREGHAGEETDSIDDMELLMDVMGAREDIANASDPAEVAEIRAQNQAKIEETLGEIERAAAEKDWPALRAAAVKLKYLEGINAAADMWPQNPTPNHM